jgi:ABC-type multidrug transport system fused ATPase/permease subunit
MASVLKLISLLTPRERRRLIPIGIAILTASLLEIVEVASLGPFMAVAADPAVIGRQRALAFLYQAGAFQSERVFLVFLGISVFAFVILAAVFRLGALFVAYRFAANRRYSLGLRLFRQYLYQPYHFFLNHNSGELSKNILGEVDLVVGGVLQPALDAAVRLVLVAAIFVFLVIMNPVVAAVAFGVFGLLYALLYGFVRPRLSRYGKDMGESNLLRYKAAAEAFGGIKDVKILGKEPFFAHAYSLGAKRFALNQSANQILSTLPAQVMQSLAIGFALALVVISLLIQGSLVRILPTLAVYAFAIVRMIPNLQAFFQSAAQIRFYSYMVDTLYKDMTTLPVPPDMAAKETMVPPPKRLSFTGRIELQGIEFSYPSSREPVLKGIDLRIPKNTTVGLVGATGCGKTTLVDVIMGLLEPTGGLIMADEIPVIASPDKSQKPACPQQGGDEVPPPDIASWQRNFGYVPQQIYLSDDTVTANIAFGIPEDMRDFAAVEHAARVANLHEFISAELPQGYNTVVGERGIRLSGGQRQRIGIARSLYHDPAILVMDEATSALDSVTEEAVMDAIHNLMHSKTIIIIAHRLSTVRECDSICLMERGRIAARGTYDELLQTSSRFRAMAKVGKR